MSENIKTYMTQFYISWSDSTTQILRCGVFMMFMVCPMQCCCFKKYIKTLKAHILTHLRKRFGIKGKHTHTFTHILSKTTLQKHINHIPMRRILYHQKSDRSSRQGRRDEKQRESKRDSERYKATITQQQNIVASLVWSFLYTVWFVF